MATNYPLVSICIPAFNAGRWISHTIESAINQTWQNKEIIIVDDGSTDNTWNIIQSFVDKYPNIIKSFVQQNRGACAARNFALEKSNGQYIQWLDADDILHPQKIENQMKYAIELVNPNVLFCGSYGIFRKNPDKSIIIQDELSRDLKPIEWMITFLGKVLMSQPGIWLIHRQLAEKAGPWDESLIRNQDGEYIFRLVSKSGFIKFTSDSKIYYRKAVSNSISSNYSAEAINFIFKSINKCIKIISEHEKSPRTDRAIRSVLNVFISKYFYTQSYSVEKAINLLKYYGEDFKGPQESVLFSIIKIFIDTKNALKLKSL